MSISVPSPEWGYVVGRLVERILDTPNDLDAFPESRAAATVVTFTPISVLDRSSIFAAFVLQLPITCALNALGELVTPGNPDIVGVWLPVGLYTVTFSTTTGPVEYQIEIRSDHTPASPQSLVSAYAGVVQ